MNTPTLSIVIPCYNQGDYLLELIACFPGYHQQSVYEIIIVDDGSSDERTLSVFNQLEREGYHIIHQVNKGLCVTRNVGITAAKGKYILPVDADDKVSVQFVYEAIEIFDHQPDYAVVYANGEYFGSKSGPWKVGKFNLQRLMLWNYLHSGSAFRKSAWEKVNGYDPKANGLEDWDFWLSIAFNGGKFYYLDKKLFDYRVMPNSAIRSVSSERFRRLLDYLEEKHDSFLGVKHLSDHFAEKFKGNKKLWLKLLLKAYFPKYLEKLVKSKKIDTDYIS
ncbi:MAG: glycosyltransferase family 2 protein [Flavobacterium sp.]|nr:MAG: glycosyltransferase family 2 protein [Flavobacterium sp.]